jgi:hypothetical protein
MKKVAISFNLANILRDTIDSAAKFKRNAPKPSDEVIEAYLIKKKRILSREEIKEVEDFLFSTALEAFLNSKENLVIPDGITNKVAGILLESFGSFHIELGYQDFFAYQFVDSLNNIVDRAFKIRNVLAKERPSESVIKLCREAYQCFLYGFHAASVALIRSLVETALKIRLNIKVGGLQEINKYAYKEGIYKKDVYNKIDQIRKRANNFIHNSCREKTPSESENLNLIEKAQVVLQALMV